MHTRWHTTIHYRTRNGAVDVAHDLNEIADLHDLVEAGPHWDTIEKIEIIRVNHCTSDALTVEQAEQM